MRSKEKKNSEDFLQHLRAICSKQSVPKVNVLEVQVSSSSSPQFSMSKGSSTLKSSSNPSPVCLKPPSPRASSVHLQSPLLLFEWDHLPSVFEKQSPLSRMLHPLHGGGFISRPRVINPALFFPLYFLFSPTLLLVQLRPSRKVIPPWCQRR